jgi:hypothetical protein
MAKKKKTKTSDANTAAARAYANEKYGPAIAQVVAAQGAARDDFDSDIESAKNAAESGKAYALNAIPNVQKTYSAAMGKADEDNSFINSELAKLGGAADVFKGANIKSQGSEHDRVTRSGADAEQALRDRATAAEAGKQFAGNQARANYRKTVGGLKQQLIDLGTQAGDAAANKLSELLQADLDRQSKTDVATIGANATLGAAETRAGAAADKAAADKAKKKPDVYGNTLKERQAARSKFKNALSLGSQLSAPGDTQEAVYQRILFKNPQMNNTLAQASANAAVHAGQITDIGLRKALRKMGIMIAAPSGGSRPGTAPAGSTGPGQQRPT